MEAKGIDFLLISILPICIAQFLIQKENWLNRGSLLTKTLVKQTHRQ